MKASVGIDKVNLIDFLEDSLFLSRAEILAFCKSAPYRYKEYTIPKRSGGVREIAQPSSELKVFQKAIVNRLMELLPVHNKAFAYRKGVGIRDNALAHKNNSYLLKMDLVDFFPSISPNMLFSCLYKNNIFCGEYDKYILQQILFKKDRDKDGLFLSIGAPSSPFLSNCIMYEFDNHLEGYCVQDGVSYTRYADDMTLSTNEKGKLLGYPKVISSLLYDLYGDSLKVKTEKTVFSSKAHNRHVTGITISNDDKLSLGRKRKRIISAKVNNYLQGTLGADNVSELQGIIAFCNYIEPLFIARLRRKYGEDVIIKIKHNHIKQN